MQTKKKKRIWPWILLGVVVLAVAGLALLNQAAKSAAQTVYAPYTVATGTVERTITGSGKLTSSDSETLRLPGGVHVDTVIAKSGDAVKAGDPLATLDLDSLKTQAAQVSSDLTTLDRSVASRSEITSVKSPVRGRVKYLPAKSGDDVLADIEAYGALALISADEKMVLEIKSTANLALYSEVKVTWEKGHATGTVVAKTADGYRITLTDDGTPYQAQAKVYDGDTLLGEGTILINSPVTVLANGGQIKSVRVSENTQVSAGGGLFSLEYAPDSASYITALSDRNEKAALYQTLLGYIADPRVLAPVDGYIDEVQLKDDTDVAEATASDGLSDAFSIHTGGAVKMSIDVDELDIDDVALNQSVSVTLDAYPGETFEASVTHISRIGESDASITTYPVEVTLQYDERLLEGMNGSAVILTATRDNVVLLPISMIKEDANGEYVFVQAADGKSYTRLDITTGLSDGTNAEITSGLAAGDIVWSPVETVNPYASMPGMRRIDNTASSSNGGE
ncbi:MAG: HlyD family efflux transporter periplasmic adaptor subunit [Christensenella sp.]|nr:HlyD family efflux transporter periplasmic adaptor subunit [Christensenella sp.]